MSGLEIERKFLVRKKGGEYKKAAFSVSHIKQGLNGGLTRYEFEIEIPYADADDLLKLCRGGFIDKRRYLVNSGSHVFEVDEFYGPNEGLVVAEVELASEDEPYAKPAFIGPEVTGDRRFRNSSLLSFPYALWQETIPEEFR